MDQTTFPAIDRGKWRQDHLLNIGDFMNTYLNHAKRVYRNDVVLEAVEVENKAVVRSHREYSSLSGLSMPDHQVKSERLKGCTNLIFCLQSVLTGITYDNQIQQFFITRDYNAGGRIPVQFFVNGMPIDAFALGGVNPDDIEGIDIFLKDELGTVSRTYQNNGVVSIYTKELPKSSGKRISLADIERMLPKANVVDLNPLGYVKHLEFYKPKYETPESKSVLDLRSTIYWNPSVLTDDSGKASVQFYNADGRGSYKVIVEGVDATGNFGRSIYKYNVN